MSPTISLAPDQLEIPPCHILIDKEGHWFYQGMEMIRPSIIELLYQNLEIEADGRIIIHLGHQRCYLEVEDAPLVVKRVESVLGPEGKTERLVLWLNDGRQEDLDPTQVTFGAENVLYCRVRQGRFEARFSRPAYYQLAEHIVPDDLSGEDFYLIIEEGRFLLKPRSIRTDLDHGPAS
ncbi:MAG: DUF1285 domain-containing protein [Deltaproteobacteria bacterium]|nr:DUF1285 domain-containing protein [Deltaproteobacteria bacterium]